jgi:uroporphyrin-III C-methyltransferase
VLYDRLVSNEILNMVREDATMVYVGKRAGFHTRTQDEIHELLSAFASAGATILRLKGGDPLVFGRGGEELDFLRDNNPNVQVEVVPGITAAAGVGSELGIPLTHRGIATSVRLLTGHLREGATSTTNMADAASDPVDFAVTAADVETTLVVYMGLGTLPRLSQKLIENGFPANMPAVAIERGTTTCERRVFSSIEHLPEAAAACELVSPTLLIVGLTVTLSPLWPYAATHSEDFSSRVYEPKWIEQRGSPRGADVDDWKIWLDVDMDESRCSSRHTFREIHVDTAF